MFNKAYNELRKIKEIIELAQSFGYILGILALFVSFLGALLLKFNIVTLENLTRVFIFLPFIFIGIYFTVKAYNQRKSFLEGLTNPYIYIESKKIECNITKEKGCTRKDTFVFRCLKKVIHEYRFFITKGTFNGDFEVMKGGTKSKNNDHPAHIEYTISFNDNGKNKKRTHEVILEWKVEKMRPFINESLNSSRGFGVLEFIINFPKDFSCKSVSICATDTETKKLVSGIEKKELGNDRDNDKIKNINWRIDNETEYPNKRNLAYMISWNWEECLK